MKKIIDLKGLSYKDFLFFDKFLTPVFLTIAYWVSLVSLAFLGFSVITSGFNFMMFSFSIGMFMILGGILLIVFGAIFIRIGFELISVLFKINRNIEKLADLQSNNEHNTQDEC